MSPLDGCRSLSEWRRPRFKFACRPYLLAASLLVTQGCDVERGGQQDSSISGGGEGDAISVRIGRKGADAEDAFALQFAYRMLASNPDYLAAQVSVGFAT